MNAVDKGIAVFLPDEAATIRLAHVLARFVSAGIAFLLYGDLGMGKSLFARSVIMRLAPDVQDVPSPTFTLMLSYDVITCGIVVPCWHVDLYRIEDARDVDELGLHDLYDNAALLIEWPERLGEDIPERAIHIQFAVAPNGQGRMVTVVVSPALHAIASQVYDAISTDFA